MTPPRKNAQFTDAVVDCLMAGFILHWQAVPVGSIPLCYGAAPDLRICPWCRQPRGGSLQLWWDHNRGVCPDRP